MPDRIDFVPTELPFSHLPADGGGVLRGRHVLAYLAGLFAIFLLLSTITIPAVRSQNQGYTEEQVQLLSPQGKERYLAAHPDAAELIVYGDSRAYIGIDPTILGRETGHSVFNYASMAHWFQSQYPQLRRIAHFWRGRTVVWPIGTLNFSTATVNFDDSVNEHAVLGIGDFADYLTLGFPAEDLYDNLLRTWLSGDLAFLRKNAILTRLDAVLARPLAGGAAARARPGWNEVRRASLAQAEREIAEAYPDAFGRKLMDGTGNPGVLLSVLRANGQNPYIELLPEYLRERQREMAAELPTKPPFAESPAMRTLFSRMLALFQAEGVRLVVVEYWDTPFNYANPGVRERLAAYLEGIRGEVESHGFRYLRVDTSDFTDADYFDYNHLGSRASREYSHRLGRLLREVVH